MCSRCQHLGLEDFGPGDWQPGFMPGERHSFSPALLWVGLGFSGQRLRLPAQTTLNMTSVNKELISCAPVSQGSCQMALC